MNSIKVNYYDLFRCTADKCEFNCCQEWRISVDEKTIDKWEGVNLRKPEVTLCDCLEKDGEGYIISLEENHQCPFQNKDKLCQLVVELGEHFLSDTCTTYPRHIKKFEDRVEYSLDFGCPAVIDLMNDTLEDIAFCKVGDEKEKHSLLYQVREMILSILKEKEYTLTERIMMTFYCLLELLEEDEVEGDVINAYKHKTNLKALAREIRKMSFNPIDSFWERNELFLDIVQFYRKEELYTDYLDEIANLAEKLEEYYSDAFLLEKNKEFEKAYAPYEKLLSHYLLGEIWGNCLEENMELEDMVMVFEWIILEYCVIKQAVFLKWIGEEKTVVEYSIVKDYIMLTSRLAGYDRSDIKEYLEMSFENTILDWGYLALVVGNALV